jgi:iron complex outermembrane recepter protein
MIRVSFRTLCLTTVFVLYAGLCIQAMQRTTNDSLNIRKYVMETVRVIAVRPEETIGSIHVIRGDMYDIKTPLNMKENLSGISGLSLTQGTKDESNLRIRGFRKNEVKVMIDGRPLNTGYFGNADLLGVVLNDLEEIQVLKGPVSSLYGNNSMGGVVNLITKAPSDRKWLKLGFLAKRNNTNQINCQVSHSFDDWDFLVNGSRSNTDGIVLPNDFEPTISENGAVRNNSNKTQYDVSARLNFTIFDFHTLGFSTGISYAERKLIPSSIYEMSDYRVYKDWIRHHSAVMGNFLTGENTSFSTMLFLDGGSDTYRQYNDPQYQFLSVDSDLSYWTFGFSPRVDWRFNEYDKLIAGLRYESQNSRRKDNGSYLNWTSHQNHVANLYTHVTHNISPVFRISESIGSTFFHTNQSSETQVTLEPSMGVYYYLGESSVLSLATGINSALPTMRQLFSAERGNPDLIPQSALKMELTLKTPFRIKSMTGNLTISVFSNRIRDLIDIRNGKYDNIHRINSYGGEIGILMNPLSWLECYGGYAYLTYSDLSDYRLTESPENSINGTFTMRLPHSVKLYADTSYNDMRFSQDASGLYRVLPYYWLHSLYLQKDFNGFSARLGIENLADKYYEEEYGFPASGRNFSLGVRTEI